MGNEKRLDDFCHFGRYVVYVCIVAELMILTQVSSMFYMVYSGAGPRVVACNGQAFPPEMENDEICTAIEQMGDNCTRPEFQWQFKSVNVEWNLYCKDAKQVKNSISVQMVGVLIGAVVFGQISDSFGRKPAMMISTFGIFLGWLLVAQSRDLLQFTITRSIVGLFTGGAISVLNVYIMENIPKKHRMWINMAITWSPNMPLLALIAWSAHAWDLFAYYNAFFCIPALLFCQFFVHESPRWYISKGRLEEARHYLKMQLSISEHHHLIDDEFEKVLLSEYEIALQQNRKKGQYSYYHLCSTYRLIITTFVLSFSYCSTSIINYGILFNLEKLSGSIYWNSVYTGLMRYACNLIFGYADLKFNWVGRKFVHTSGLVVVLISLAVVISAYYFGLNHQLNTVITLLILLASSMTSQIYIADGIVGNELFPTPIRNLGYSVLQLWNRVGVIFSPIVFYLTDYWIALPYCVMLSMALIDTFAFECLLPETKGRPLIEHMPPRHERIFGKKKAAAMPESSTEPSPLIAEA